MNVTTQSSSLPYLAVWSCVDIFIESIKFLWYNIIRKLYGEIHSQDRDVAKYWKNSQINIALFGLENQTVPDKLMPMRVIGYDGAEYKKQVLEENRYSLK